MPQSRADPLLHGPRQPRVGQVQRPAIHDLHVSRTRWAPRPILARISRSKR
jgi:hypothetical protein